MADGGASKQQDAIKWNLLSGIKSTVDVLLASQNANIWSTYGGLMRIVDDLERILRHGLKSHQDFFGVPTGYDIILRNAGFVFGKSTGTTWLKETLLAQNLLSHFTKLIANEQLINDYYEDFAFLRSPEHCQALLTCIQAVETNNPSVLTQLNNTTMVDNGKITHPWTTREADSNNLFKSYDDIVSGCETGLAPERKPNMSETETHFSKYYYHEDATNIGFTSGNAELLEENHLHVNVDRLCSERKDDLDIEDIENDAVASTDIIEKHDMLLAKEKLQFKGLKLVDTKKRKRNIDQGTLAQVALSAVMESDERSSPSLSWFEGETRPQRRRSSSFSEADSSKSEETKGKLETEITNNRDSNFASSDVVDSSDYKAKKALGHSRSKSDGTRLIKTTKRQQSLKEIPRAKQETALIENQLRLSSSLPESSVEFYHNDPLSTHEEETSFASMLALQDLSSCELEKENAHFSISEALIQAIEQMKCDQIIASDDEDEDEDDEEIQHLKLEIERRRLEKKREKLRLQPAFSDETPKSPSNHSSISDHSTKSSSSKSSIIDTNDIDPDWEEISFSEEHAANLSNFSASETTLVPEANPSLDLNTNLESSASPPLSAEAVAKSLLKKFANKKHPAASELQWLVSENDVPQSLLPLPKTFSVDPDEVARDSDDLKDRRKSLPCRIRGNLEWAPPRFQIIFHIPPTVRRRQLMAQQNYRCVGCGMQVDPGYMKRFRYCNYLGKYFCSSCHHNSLMVIPARVVRRWDFRKYEVSKFAMDLLTKIYSDPLFNIKDLNPLIYQKVRILETMRNLRKQLYFLKTFAQTCRKSDHLQQEFSRIPTHLLSDEHLYSLQDLIQVKSGELPAYFKTLATQSLLHIGECPLCQAKGFICEYCRNGEDIIYPFELDRVIQCNDCRASFHRDCYVKGKCPKCERIQIRKSLVAAPLSTTYED